MANQNHRPHLPNLHGDSAKWIAIIISLAVAFAGVSFGAIGISRAQQYEALENDVDLNTLSIRKLEVRGAEINIQLQGMRQSLQRIERALESQDGGSDAR